MYLGAGCLWERWMLRPRPMLDFSSLTVPGKTVLPSPCQRIMVYAGAPRGWLGPLIPSPVCEAGDIASLATLGPSEPQGGICGC